MSGLFSLAVISLGLISLEKYSGFCVDSRLAKPGDLFFALDGERVDGHQFIDDAIQKGATGIVIRKDFDIKTLLSKSESFSESKSVSELKSLSEPESKSKSVSVYRVDNPLETLQNLAKEKLANHSARVVAVTGSVGKTTTKGFIATILAKKFKTSLSPGNYNSQIGVPLSVLNYVTTSDEVIVLEMGMDHAGQIKKLVEIAPPDVAIITAVELVHAVNFSSLEGIRLAKEEIYSHPKTKETIALYGASNKAKITYSMHSPEANFYYDRDRGVIVERIQKSDGNEQKYENDKNEIHNFNNNYENSKKLISVESPRLPTLNLLGDHTVQNFLGAVAVSRTLGVSWEMIMSAIPDLKLPGGRLESSVINGITFLNDAYNACVPSMKGAIKAMPEPVNGGSRIAVLGDMRELGQFSKEAHREVKAFAEAHLDKVYFLGNEWSDGEDEEFVDARIAEKSHSAERSHSIVTNRETIIADLQKTLRSGDILLVKGSRVWALENVIKELVAAIESQSMIDNNPIINAIKQPTTLENQPKTFCAEPLTSKNKLNIQKV